MNVEIKFTPTAAAHVRSFRRYEQAIILDAVETHLAHEPTTATRNRKRLGENVLSDWELRVDRFRVFYDVLDDDAGLVVKIKAVGHKDHNRLFVGGLEIHL